MEPLKKVEEAKWPEIRDLFKADYPDGVVGFCLFDMLVSSRGQRQMLVYCPFGDIHNGVVCVTEEFDSYNVYIQPLKCIKKIEDALSTTKVIDWNRNIMVPSASPAVLECLKRLQEKIGVKVLYDGQSAAVKFYLQTKTDVFEDLRPPPNTYVGPLKPEHIAVVDKTWTYHGDQTHRFFETLMKLNLTWVLYSSEDSQPLAWITMNQDGALTHLFCLEHHRRKGCAEYISKVAIRAWLDRGKCVLVYTVAGNVKAQQLFKKLRFQVIGTDYWLFLNKV